MPQGSLAFGVECGRRKPFTPLVALEFRNALRLAVFRQTIKNLYGIYQFSSVSSVRGGPRAERTGSRPQCL